MLVHAKQMGDGFTFFVVYGRVHHLVDTDKVRVVERDFPLLSRQGDQRGDQAPAAPPAERGRAPASAPTRTPSASTRSSTSRASPARRAWSTTGSCRVTNLGAQVSRAGPGRDGPGRRRPTRCWFSQVVTQRDAHLHNTRAMSAAFREALPAGRRPLLVVGGPALRRADGRRAGRRPHLRPRHHAPRGRLLPRPRARRPEGSCRSEVTVTHRRYVPYAHAHYAGQPGRRRVLAGPVRRRRHRGVHPAGRRRGAVRVLFGRAVPGAGAGRRRAGGHRRR